MSVKARVRKRFAAIQLIREAKLSSQEESAAISRLGGTDTPEDPDVVLKDLGIEDPEKTLQMPSATS